MGLMSDKRAKQREKQPTAPVVDDVVPEAKVDPLAGAAMTQEEVEASTVEETVAEQDPPVVDDVVPEVTAVVAPARVRVVQDGKVLIGACVHRFKAGNILDPSHYDERILSQILGVLKTEPVKD